MDNRSAEFSHALELAAVSEPPTPGWRYLKGGQLQLDQGDAADEHQPDCT